MKINSHKYRKKKKTNKLTFLQNQICNLISVMTFF